jgi:cytoskeletal protein RodZ
MAKDRHNFRPSLSTIQRELNPRTIEEQHRHGLDAYDHADNGPDSRPVTKPASPKTETTAKRRKLLVYLAAVATVLIPTVAGVAFASWYAAKHAPALAPSATPTASAPSGPTPPAASSASPSAATMATAAPSTTPTAPSAATSTPSAAPMEHPRAVPSARAHATADPHDAPAPSTPPPPPPATAEPKTAPEAPHAPVDDDDVIFHPHKRGSP